MKCNSYNRFFEVFANKTRLSIIESLIKKPKCVSEISVDLGEEQSKISHNLKVLSDCHFVDFKQDGKKRVYQLNKYTIKPLIDLVNKHVSKYCCADCSAKTGLKNNYKIEDKRVNKKIIQIG